MKSGTSYKHSGLQWLDLIPSSWSVQRTDRFMDLCKEVVKVESLKGRAVYHYSIPSFQEIGDGRVEDGDTIDSDKLRVVGGELLISKLNPRKASVLITKEQPLLSVCSGEFVVLRPHESADLRFVYYLYLSQWNRERISSTVQSATRSHQRANPEDIYKIYNPVPPLPEQRAIAAFLDDKTAKIDTLIEKKRRLIELLKEERQAVINHAVTKGLDPHAKMKPSGIEWLGDVPEGWEIWKVSHAFGIIGSGTTPKSDNTEYHSGGTVPWLITGDLNDDRITSTSKSITQLALTENPTLRRYPPGCLAIAMYGATIGKIGLLELEATTNQACCVLGDPRVFNMRFVFYWFLANKANVISLGVGGGQPNISQDLVRALKLPCPPIEEQRAIIRYLDSRTATTTAFIATAERAMALLTEYRTALITEAVTGRLDVATL